MVPEPGGAASRTLNFTARTSRRYDNNGRHLLPLATTRFDPSIRIRCTTAVAVRCMLRRFRMLSAPQLRRFARNALVTATGVPQPHRGQLASAFNLLCEQLRARLQPLFGATAVSALFARARHLATAEFPWLSEVVPEDGERCSLDALERASGTLPSPSIEEGLAAVLAHEVRLLTAFIGDDFVMPLVQEAWGATLLSERAAPGEGDHE